MFFVLALLAIGTTALQPSECENVEGYIDAHGDECSAWIFFDCTKAMEDYDFTAEEQQALIDNCASTCDKCTDCTSHEVCATGEYCSDSGYCMPDAQCCMYDDVLWTMDDDTCPNSCDGVGCTSDSDCRDEDNCGTDGKCYDKFECCSVILLNGTPIPNVDTVDGSCNIDC